MRVRGSFSSFVLGALFMTSPVFAQTVTLEDTSATTMLTATVSEQATLAVPTSVTFSVTNISTSTAALAASVNVSNIVLATATKQVKVSLQASGASFTPPVSGATTWAASDVSWNAAAWTNGTGAAGTLGSAAYTEVARCAADASSCNTSDLVFTLAPKTTVKRSGDHTLQVRWKFEAIGS
jgi:hypothetical protein